MRTIARAQSDRFPACAIHACVRTSLPLARDVWHRATAPQVSYEQFSDEKFASNARVAMDALPGNGLVVGAVGDLVAARPGRHGAAYMGSRVGRQPRDHYSARRQNRGRLPRPTAAKMTSWHDRIQLPQQCELRRCVAFAVVARGVPATFRGNAGTVWQTLDLSLSKSPRPINISKCVLHLVAFPRHNGIIAMRLRGTYK